MGSKYSKMLEAVQQSSNEACWRKAIHMRVVNTDSGKPQDSVKNQQVAGALRKCKQSREMLAPALLVIFRLAELRTFMLFPVTTEK